MFCYPLTKIYAKLVHHLAPVPDSLSLFLKIHYDQVKQLEQSVVCWKGAFIFGCFPNNPIEAFNRVGGINNLPYLPRIPEKRRERFPVVTPALHRISVLATPYCLKFVKGFKPRLFIRSSVDELHISAKPLPVLPADKLAAVPYLVDNAPLDLGLRKY